MTPSGKTFLIGVLLRSSTVRTTLNGILERARELGYGVLISDSGSSLEGEKKGPVFLFQKPRGRGAVGSVRAGKPSERV